MLNLILDRILKFNLFKLYLHIAKNWTLTITRITHIMIARDHYHFYYYWKITYPAKFCRIFLRSRTINL